MKGLNFFDTARGMYMSMPRHELMKGLQVLDGRATLKCTEDCMEARLIPQGREDAFKLADMAMELLEPAGIVHGRLETPRPLEDGSFLLAAGTPPENGKDSKITYKVLPDVSGGQGEDPPKECCSEEELLELFRSNPLINVAKGQVLAVRTPPTKGRPGKDIFGREAAPAPGKWIPFKFGEGTEVSTNDLALESILDGVIVIDEERRIHVKDEIALDPSRELATPNITFWGKRLEIKGSIQGGTVVDVRGDLTVRGSIEDEARVKVGGNLTVEGIIRAQETLVEVGKDLVCKAVERAAVKVRGNLEVKDYVLDARCEVEGNVDITQGKGLLLGGRMLVRGFVRTQVTGGPANVPTLIHVGYNPPLKKELKRLSGLIEYSRTKLEGVENGLKKIKRFEKMGPLADNLRHLKHKLKSARDALYDHMSACRAQLVELQNQAAPLKEAFVEVFSRAYANTTVIVDDVSLQLPKDMEKVRFCFFKGDVVAKDI